MLSLLQARTFFSRTTFTRDYPTPYPWQTAPESCASTKSSFSATKAVRSRLFLFQDTLFPVTNFAVGKTSLITRFMYDTFDDTYAATIGIDFLLKTMYLDNNQTIRLQLWDTAGQERFRSLIPSYIRDSHVTVVCFDLTSRKSFDNVSKWVDDVRRERGDDVIVVLVGNKSDLATSQRQVTLQDAEPLCEKIGAAFYIETSTKANHNVKALFRKIALSLPEFGEQKKQDAQQPDIVDITVENTPQNTACGC